MMGVAMTRGLAPTGEPPCPPHRPHPRFHRVDSSPVGSSIAVVDSECGAHVGVTLFPYTPTQIPGLNQYTQTAMGVAR